MSEFHPQCRAAPRPGVQSLARSGRGCSANSGPGDSRWRISRPAGQEAVPMGAAPRAAGRRPDRPRGTQLVPGRRRRRRYRFATGPRRTRDRSTVDRLPRQRSRPLRFRRADRRLAARDDCRGEIDPIPARGQGASDVAPLASDASDGGASLPTRPIPRSTWQRRPRRSMFSPCSTPRFAPVSTANQLRSGRDSRRTASWNRSRCDGCSPARAHWPNRRWNREPVSGSTKRVCPSQTCRLSCRSAMAAFASWTVVGVEPRWDSSSTVRTSTQATARSSEIDDVQPS